MSAPASPNSGVPTGKEIRGKWIASLLGCAVLVPLLFGFFALAMWLLSLAGSEQLTWVIEGGPWDRPIRYDHLKDAPDLDPLALDCKLARGESMPIRLKTGILFKSAFSHGFNRTLNEPLTVTLDAPDGLDVAPAAWEAPEFSALGDRAFQSVQLTARNEAPLGRQTIRCKVRRPGANKAFERTFSIEIVAN